MFIHLFSSAVTICSAILRYFSILVVRRLISYCIQLLYIMNEGFNPYERSITRLANVILMEENRSQYRSAASATHTVIATIERPLVVSTTTTTPLYIYVYEEDTVCSFHPSSIEQTFSIWCVPACACVRAVRVRGWKHSDGRTDGWTDGWIMLGNFDVAAAAIFSPSFFHLLPFDCVCVRSFRLRARGGSVPTFYGSLQLATAHSFIRCLVVCAGCKD